jgi:molecular chaperone GrpE
MSDSEKDRKIKNNGSGKEGKPGKSESSANTDLQPELPADPHSRLTELEEELTREKDKYLRLFAEFDNFKKRNVRDRIELLKYANEEVITSLLPVLDDLERARDAGQLTEGLLLIYQKLVNILAQRGLRAMETKGQVFDPEFHDALSRVETEEDSGKNKVVEEIEKGYYLNDKVIRHAKVVVGA